MFLAIALTRGIHPPENIQNGGRSNRVWRLTKVRDTVIEIHFIWPETNHSLSIYLWWINRDDLFNKALITALINIQNDISKLNYFSLIPVTVWSSFKRSFKVRKNFSWHDSSRLAGLIRLIWIARYYKHKANYLADGALEEVESELPQTTTNL